MQGLPQRGCGETGSMGPGAAAVGLLFLCTVATTASFHSFLQLPPVLGMMTGAGAR